MLQDALPRERQGIQLDGDPALPLSVGLTGRSVWGLPGSGQLLTDLSAARITSVTASG